MKRDRWNVSRMLLVATALALVTTSAIPTTDNAFSDAAIKRAMPRNAPSDRVNEASGKDEKKPALVMKVLKEVQRRSCRTAPRNAPPASSSWPARGQTAMSMCS